MNSVRAGDPAVLAAQIVIRRSTFNLDVRLSVAPGEVLVVLGRNGAGKSTLLQCIAGLLPLSEGRITLGDSVLDDPAAGLFRPAAERHVGVVFQDYKLFPTLRVLDNVAFAARARGAGRAASRRAARRWIDALELGELAQRRPATLSGGQAQRVALARALAADPVVLLLDEPLAALDARTRVEVRATLGAQVRSFLGPTVLVTHDPADVQALADRVLVLDAGRVVQQGTPAEVARDPVSAYAASMLGSTGEAGGTGEANGTGRS